MPRSFLVQIAGMARSYALRSAMRPPLIHFAAILGLMLTAGCAVGPDFQRPAAPTVDAYTPEPLASETASVDIHGGEAQQLVQDMDIPGQWWTLFHSKPLSGLIEQALNKNPDLESAQAA